MEYGLIGGKLGHSYSKTIHELFGRTSEISFRQSANKFASARDFSYLRPESPKIARL